MNHKKFVDELKSLGVRFEEGTKHYKVYFGDRQTVALRHPTKEYSKVYMLKIKKQLGIK